MQYIDTLLQFIKELPTSQAYATMTLNISIFILILLIGWTATKAVRSILIPRITTYIHNSNYQWDDPLLTHNFFEKLTWFVPIAIFHLAKDIIFPPESWLANLLGRFILSGFIICSIFCISSLLNAMYDIHRHFNKKYVRSIRGYLDAIKIVTYSCGIIFLFAALTDRSPWGIFSILGGVTAVTMLIFKDTILGFVASIQLTGTDMVRPGDWIEMPKYDADGDVIDVSIHSVIVRNWDKTITTIPTYALISNSFKNWRGMTESGGRRIKRAIYIDMNSIRFATEEELQKFSKITLLKKYLKNKQEEIELDNKEKKIDNLIPINGRRQTNIGIFRAYLENYLKNHPKIHTNMTFLIRHLAPTEKGLPIELYIFSNDQIWANYEAIQADIFDHIFAILPEFSLRVFQNPSGYDFRQLHHNTPDPEGT
ncbi:MAG: mechanosensitive ion channel family protein [Desulfobulbaceae bacterium]|nr:mechanosensitive ion channel family protein [Desulfobulbaceae bacterium]